MIFSPVNWEKHFSWIVYSPLWIFYQQYSRHTFSVQFLRFLQRQVSAFYASNQSFVLFCFDFDFDWKPTLTGSLQIWSIVPVGEWKTGVRCWLHPNVIEMDFWSVCVCVCVCERTVFWRKFQNFLYFLYEIATLMIEILFLALLL